MGKIPESLLYHRKKIKKSKFNFESKTQETKLCVCPA